MSINLYNLGIGAFKGIEEENQKRFQMIQQMVPLMQQTYLENEQKRDKAEDNRSKLYKTLGTSPTNALLNLHRTEIDASDKPIETAKTLINGYGGINSSNFKAIVSEYEEGAPALTGQSKYDASKQFFIDNNIVGPAGFDLLNEETMQQSMAQQPMAEPQIIEQAALPEGETLKITRDDPAKQDYTPAVSANVFGAMTRPAKFEDDPYHGPLYSAWKDSTGAIGGGATITYDVWLRKERPVKNPNYNPSQPPGPNNQRTIKKTNEEIYNDLLIRQDPSRITIVAEKQRELEGGEIMFSKEDYLYEYEQARREGNEAKMQALLEESVEAGVDISDELGLVS